MKTTIQHKLAAAIIAMLPAALSAQEHIEADIGEHLFSAVAVGERDIMKSDITMRLSERTRVLRISLHRRIYQLAEARKTTHAVLQLLDEVDEIFYRCQKDIDKNNERRKVGDGDHTLVCKYPAENKDDYIQNIDNEIVSREKFRHCLIGFSLCLNEV